MSNSKERRRWGTHTSRGLCPPGEAFRKGPGAQKDARDGCVSWWLRTINPVRLKRYLVGDEVVHQAHGIDRGASASQSRTPTGPVREAPLPKEARMTYDSERHPPPITLGDFELRFDEPRIRTVKPSATVERAEEIMDDRNIDQVPVLDPKSDPRVLTRRMVSRVRLVERTATRVDEVPDINDPPRMLAASTPLADAVCVLIEHDWVLTTGSNGVAEGLATVGDALRAAMNRLEG